MTHPKLLSAMQNPDFYPGKPDHVDVIQTHISYIFIAGDQVYKVKKAVDFGFPRFYKPGQAEAFLRGGTAAEPAAGARRLS